MALVVTVTRSLANGMLLYVLLGIVGDLVASYSNE